MANFKKILNQAAPGRKIVLQGNIAFALGTIHAGYHAADGYPGTPSTEILDHLRQVPEEIIAEWSVNEAVAAGVAVGHAIAGHDTVVTMKVPGLFQAGDVIASAAFSDSFSGALVFFIATDHVPSSTQYLVDSRHFLSSIHLPVIEPRDHQDLYFSAIRAANVSRQFSTPVAIVCSSVLCHSEGIVIPMTQRVVKRAPFKTSKSKVLLPKDARSSFINSVKQKIPKIRSFLNTTDLNETIRGKTDWGIIACGEASLIVKETISQIQLSPHQLYIGITHPLPIASIKQWLKYIRGPVFLIEDGERFVEMQLRQNGIKTIGKKNLETVTHWTPDIVMDLLSENNCVNPRDTVQSFVEQPLLRPPAICPGCPYKTISLVINKLKKQDKLDLVFGDIGCSTLLHFQNALDINLCMGASESMRQGFVRSKPLSASRIISLIGDSSECHSGMNASLNAIFRSTPGVKIILDNGAVAMTGGQETPTRKDGLGNKKLHLQKNIEAQGIACIKVDAYNEKAVQTSLEEALERAKSGHFSTLIIEGECIKTNKNISKKGTQLHLNKELCTNCGLCNICPAIVTNSKTTSLISSLCTRCGPGQELCVQRCRTGALYIKQLNTSSYREYSNNLKNAIKNTQATDNTDKEFTDDLLICNLEGKQYHFPPKVHIHEPTDVPFTLESDLPDSLRILICGVGGQGNLFLGKVLTQLMQSTPYISKNIIKGEVHGMAQKGGCVSSTFACGDVYSPIFSSQSVDIMIALEQNEALRPHYLDLLRPNATIILNHFSITPTGATADDLFTIDQVMEQLKSFNIIQCNANMLAPRNANIAILGLLSGIHPFSSIPTDQWIQILTKLSKSPNQARQNVNAFERGRNELIYDMT